MWNCYFQIIYHDHKKTQNLLFCLKFEPVGSKPILLNMSIVLGVDVDFLLFIV
jgi:hypothetical protein